MEMRLRVFFSSISFSQPKVKLSAFKAFKFLRHVLRQMLRIQPLQMKLDSIKCVSVSTPVTPCSASVQDFSRRDSLNTEGGWRESFHLCH